MKRYALLDTDFISKTYSVQDDGGNHLMRKLQAQRFYPCRQVGLAGIRTEYLTMQ